jgi:hypothetical protein
LSRCAGPGGESANANAGHATSFELLKAPESTKNLVAEATRHLHIN